MRIISGIYGGRSIRTIPGEGMRPATGRLRSALFSMLEARGVAWNGLRVLDLLQAELPLKTAVRLAAEISGEPRKALYAEALARQAAGDAPDSPYTL